jgi:hypothetical protein
METCGKSSALAKEKYYTSKDQIMKCDEKQEKAGPQSPCSGLSTLPLQTRGGPRDLNRTSRFSISALGRS